MLTVEEHIALEQACKVISSERAKALHELLKWKHGGCLSRERPDVANVSDAEDAAVRAVWDSIPSGSSSWMTAFYRILNHQQGENL